MDLLKARGLLYPRMQFIPLYGYKLTAKPRNANYTKAWKHLVDPASMEHGDIAAIQCTGHLARCAASTGAIAAQLCTLGKPDHTSQEL